MYSFYKEMSTKLFVIPYYLSKCEDRTNFVLYDYPWALAKFIAQGR